MKIIDGHVAVRGHKVLYMGGLNIKDIVLDVFVCYWLQMSAI